MSNIRLSQLREYMVRQPPAGTALFNIVQHPTLSTLKRLNAYLFITVDDGDSPVHQPDKQPTFTRVHAYRCATNVEHKVLQQLSGCHLENLLKGTELRKNPASTRRCFDVDSTSFERYGRQMDVEKTLCAYWKYLKVKWRMNNKDFIKTITTSGFKFSRKNRPRSRVQRWWSWSSNSSFEKILIISKEVSIEQFAHKILLNLKLNKIRRVFKIIGYRTQFSTDDSSKRKNRKMVLYK